MAFVLARGVSTLCGQAVLRPVVSGARRLRSRHTLTPQEQANFRVNRTPSAVTLASLGGHVHR